jgi:hypothetical protein
MTLSFTHDAQLVVDCDRCEGRGEVYRNHEPDYCGACGGSGDDYFDVSVLIGNLVVGAGLCRAFWLGHRASVLSGRNWDRRTLDLPEFEFWAPYCGRSAP